VATKHLYNLGYRFFRMPWEIGPRGELVELVTSGGSSRDAPWDLGCGTGANAVFLARQGFDVTASTSPRPAWPRRSRRLRRRVSASRWCALISPRSIRIWDRLTCWWDYGTFDDLSDVDRARYVESVSRLAHPGSEFLLWCFEWPLRPP
jgi:hypothetical protein